MSAEKKAPSVSTRTSWIPAFLKGTNDWCNSSRTAKIIVIKIVKMNSVFCEFFFASADNTKNANMEKIEKWYTIAIQLNGTETEFPGRLEKYHIVMKVINIPKKEIFLCLLK